MKAETMELARRILAQHPEVDAWFAVEKVERKGLFFKYYIMFYNPKQNRGILYKARHDEYLTAQLGQAYVHHGFR